MTALGIGLESGLEVIHYLNTDDIKMNLLSFSLFFWVLILQYVGVDPLQAGNAVQLILVLGLTLGWISTYIFRVGNKEMTYAQQLRDYESQVMQVCSFL